MSELGTKATPLEMIVADASEQDTPPAPPQELLIDPFDFHVGIASRIRGLGGATPGHDPQYAFHTPYVDVAAGPAHFLLRFTGLKARKGTLQLWVNMLSTEPGARAHVANSERMKLNWIVQQGGTTYIRFEAFRGVRFALHGMIVDDTDAEAEALVVVLDRPAGLGHADIGAVEAQSSNFGRDKVTPATHMISLKRATLANPVAQMATGLQQSERPFADAVRELRLQDRDRLDQWRSVYIFQTLRRYGMLEAGARALGIGAATHPLPAALAGHGIEVVATGTSDEALRAATTDPHSTDAAAGQVTYRRVDIAGLPGDLANFDMLWSDEVTANLESVAAGISFIEASIGCLRPGGLAVHVVPYDPRQAPREHYPASLCFRRPDVERLALILISRAFEVAQIKLDSRAPLRRADGMLAGATSFGLIVRRPPSVY